MTRATTIKAIALFSALTVVTTATPIHAQTVGVGVGVGVPGGPRNRFAQPFFGGFPLDYPGFYGNGMSWYGPPVPTYGSIPGTFGGSDYRVSQNAPFIGFPIGIYATYSRPRRGGEPSLLDAEAMRIAVESNSMLVEVRIPLENTIVFINDRITKQSGHVRYFSSPTLQSGERYRYTVRAVWTIDGQRNDKTLTVEGKPGERVVADFSK